MDQGDTHDGCGLGESSGDAPGEFIVCEHSKYNADIVF